MKFFSLIILFCICFNSSLFAMQQAKQTELKPLTPQDEKFQDFLEQYRAHQEKQTLLKKILFCCFPPFEYRSKVSSHSTHSTHSEK